MSLRVAREAPKEVVARRRGRRICIRAADLVGAEVARTLRARVVARDARMYNCYQQQTLVRSLHGSSRRVTSAAQRSWGLDLDAKLLSSSGHKCASKCDQDALNLTEF